MQNDNIIRIKGFIFTVLETPSGLFYFIPVKYHKYTKRETKMIEDLVSNYRHYYIGRDKEKIIKNINKFINKLSTQRLVG